MKKNNYWRQTMLIIAPALLIYWLASGNIDEQQVDSAPPAAMHYDQAEIKAAITKRGQEFGLIDWKQAETSGNWIANSHVKGMVLSVGDKSAGFIIGLSSSSQASMALGMCLTLADIGLKPDTTASREQIGSNIKAATAGSKAPDITMHGVSFSSNAKQVGNSVFLSCILTPAS